MEPIIDRTDFVDDFVDHFLRQYASKFEDTVKVSGCITVVISAANDTLSLLARQRSTGGCACKQEHIDLFGQGENFGYGSEIT